MNTHEKSHRQIDWSNEKIIGSSINEPTRRQFNCQLLLPNDLLKTLCRNHRRPLTGVLATKLMVIPTGWPLTIKTRPPPTSIPLRLLRDRLNPFTEPIVLTLRLHWSSFAPPLMNTASWIIRRPGERIRKRKYGWERVKHYIFPCLCIRFWTWIHGDFENALDTIFSSFFHWNPMNQT